QLLRIGAGPALAAHLLRDRQLDCEAPVGGPAPPGAPAFDHCLGCVQDVHVSSSRASGEHCPTGCRRCDSRASDPRAAAAVGTTSSDVGKLLISRSVTLPTSIRLTHPFPCEPTTSRSARHWAASRRIVSRAAPYRTSVATPGVRIRDQMSCVTVCSRSHRSRSPPAVALRAGREAALS